MFPLSSFNRDTFKLLIAAGLVLGGAFVATAQAQDAISESGSFSPMSAEALAAHPSCVIYADGRRALIQGAVLDGDQANVDMQVADRQGRGERLAVSAGDGGFFTADVAVSPNVYAAFVTRGSELLGMGVCTRPNIAPAPGMGLGGVALSNSTSADETAENVQLSVDAINLF